MPGVELHRIAVAVDGSTFATDALEFAIDLAKRYGAQLEVVSVAPLPVYVASAEPWVPTEVPELEIKHYHDLVDAAVRRCEEAGISAVTGVCLEGHIVDELVSHLEQHPADLLVMGSRGLSTAKRLLLGSVSDAISHHVRCPVLLVRGSSAGESPG